MDEGRCVKAVRQLRRELDGEGLPTQEVVEESDVLRQDDGSIAIAVALVGAGGAVPTLVAVLRDWIQRRKSPGKIVVTLGDDSIEMERPTFDERAELLEAFLKRHS
ncbi:effector-associated constant component EACC1 [Kribbella sp. CA-245084]|uniref:effector-associated constant component EACC1 n=1 Tax=Kribbella sp. CA-245084 TaxID=3239940 RepID=UPI003D89DDE7